MVAFNNYMQLDLGSQIIMSICFGCWEYLLTMDDALELKLSENLRALNEAGTLRPLPPGSCLQ